MAELGPQRQHGIRKGKAYGQTGRRVLTATFAECGENEPGMEMLGQMGPPEIAVTVKELKEVHAVLTEAGHECYLHKFHRAVNHGPLGPVAEALPEADPLPAAGVLVVRGLFKPELVDAAEKALWDESVPIDTMALMGRGKRRKVFNKNARHNNCMTEGATRSPNIASKEDYAEGKGSVLALEEFPHMNKMRRRVERLLKRKLGVVENNYYYRVGRENGIGWVRLVVRTHQPRTPAFASGTPCMWLPPPPLAARRQGAARGRAAAPRRGGSADAAALPVVLELQGMGTHLPVAAASRRRGLHVARRRRHGLGRRAKEALDDAPRHGRLSLEAKERGARDRAADARALNRRAAS